MLEITLKLKAETFFADIFGTKIVRPGVVQDLFQHVRQWAGQLRDLDNVTANCGDHQVFLALDSLEEFCRDQSVTIIVVLVVIFLVLVILGLVLYMWHKVHKGHNAQSICIVHC